MLKYQANGSRAEDVSASTPHYKMSSKCITYENLHDSDIQEEFITMHGFVLKKSQNPLLMCDDCKTWSHVGNPLEEIYNCGSPDSCKIRGRRLENSAFEVNKIHFVSINIDKPDNSFRFALNPDYLDYENIFGFRCVSKELRFNTNPLRDVDQFNEYFEIALNWLNYGEEQVTRTLVFQNSISVQKRVNLKSEFNSLEAIYATADSSQYTEMFLESVFLESKFVFVTHTFALTGSDGQGGYRSNFAFGPDLDSIDPSYQPTIEFKINSEFSNRLSGKFYLTETLNEINLEIIDIKAKLIGYTENYCTEAVTGFSVLKQVFFKKESENIWVIYTKPDFIKETVVFTIGYKEITVEYEKTETVPVAIKFLDLPYFVRKGTDFTFKAIFIDQEGFSAETADTTKINVIDKTGDSKTGSGNDEDVLSDPVNCLTHVLNISDSGLFKIMLKKGENVLSSAQNEDVRGDSKVAVIEDITGCENNFISIQTNLTCSNSCSKMQIGKFCLDSCTSAIFPYDTDNPRSQCYAKECFNNQGEPYKEQYEYNRQPHPDDAKSKYCELSEPFVDNNTCLQECPSTKPFFRQDYVCLKTCPTGQVSFRNQCLDKCPEERPYSLDSVCVSQCPSYMVLNEEEMECYPVCYRNKMFSGTKCVDSCPNQKFIKEINNNLFCSDCVHEYKDYKNKKCYSECPGNTSVDQVNMECYSDCGTNFEYKGTCYSNCTDGLLTDIPTKRCVTACPEGRKQGGNTCFDSCPDFTHPGQETCLSDCDFYEEDCEGVKYCVESCSDGMFELNGSIPKKCLDTCPSGYYHFEGNGERKCSNTCPSAGAIGSYFVYDEEPKKYCKSTCIQENFVYEEENGETLCRSSCENGKFKYFDGGIKKCLRSCPLGFQFILRGECVNGCPDRMFPDDNNNCLANCPEYSRGQVCVDTCDQFVIPLPGFEEGKGECVERCPPLLESYYETDRVCLSHCPLYQNGNKCLKECNSFIEENQDRLICKEQCEDPKHLNTLKTRSICVTNTTTSNQTVIIRNITYGIPENCSRILKEDNILTDEDCITACRDESAFALSISEHRCVTDCPQDRPFFEGSTCVEQCNKFFTRNGECLSDCNVDYPYTQTLEGKSYCASSCEDGWKEGEKMNCYNPVKIECDPPEVQVEDRCESCPFQKISEKGKCVDKCSPCYTMHVLTHCQLCETAIHHKKCVDKCPKGYITNPNSDNCPLDCAKCSKVGMISNEGECVSKCPEDKFQRGSECYSCDQVDSFETDEEKRICGSCDGIFKNRDGSCSPDCSDFRFTKEKQQYCLNCRGLFFYKDHCTEKCPENTVTYSFKKECLDLPQDCQKEASKCKRNSSCQLLKDKPKCACRTGTYGLLCQVLKDEIIKETDPQTIASWSSITQLNTITLQNAFRLQYNPISDQNLLKTLLNLTTQAFETNNSNFFILSDFSLSPTTFESKSEIISRKQGIITRILQKVDPTRKRNLSQTSKYMDYQGENYSLTYSNDISSKIDLSECKSKLRTQLNKPEAQFDFIYLQLNNHTVEAAPAASTTTLKLNSQPHVTVSIYFENQPQEVSSLCSLENVDLKYEVTPEADSSEIEKLKDQGVNPFDPQDDFFTDVCSLSNSGSDLTLSRRKELFYLDPAKICNQQEGQVCSIDQFSGEKVSCTCRGINNNPPSLNDSFATTFAESNFKIIKCYNRFFTRRMHLNPGFLLSFGVLIFFYILQNLSAAYTLYRLRNKPFTSFLNNSLVVVNQTNIKLDKYFSKSTSPGIRIINPNTSATPEPSVDNSANRIKDLSEETNSVDDLDTLKAIGPTRLDYDSLTVTQQIEFDKRSPLSIFAAQSLRNHIYLNSFCYDYLLVPLHIRLFLLMTIILVAMSLNGFFYTDTLIDNRAKAKDAVYS